MMRDFKSPKNVKVKGNRSRQEHRPRDWQRLFQRLLRVGLFAGSVTMTVAGGFLMARMVFFSEYFQVDSVRVEAHQRLDQEEILELSDIDLGANIFDLDLAMIGSKIEEDPWIASARVERVFPREIVIRVVERAPRGIINLGYLYYFDDSGAVFKLLDPADSLDYPVLTGLDRRFLLESPEEARRQLIAAAELIKELTPRKAFNLKHISELNINQIEGFSLCTYIGGIPIRLGFGEYAAKLDRLEQIYHELAPRLAVLAYIDLNVMDRVIVKIDKRAPGRS